MKTMNKESASHRGKVLTALMATVAISIMGITLMVNLHSSSVSGTHSAVFNMNANSILRTSSGLETWMTRPFEIKNARGKIFTESYSEAELLIEPWMIAPF